MSKEEIFAALEHLRNGEFRPGNDMEMAHEICQRHEGEAMFDWLHALVHRVEGDQSNADYWYRRSGHPRHDGPVADEWEIIHEAAHKA